MDKIQINHYVSSNVGDALNLALVEKISNKKTETYKDNLFKKILRRLGVYRRPNYLVIGSYIHNANKNSIIWGAGYISSDSCFKERPKKVLAVRGPLTRERLIKQGVDCPKIYGDPALLLPLIYKPKTRKKYKLGIIPHYVDYNSKLLNNFKKDKEILIIDVNKNYKEFVKDLLSCKRIASSSLHGIIISDAYKIPSLWIKLSDKVIGKNFKFLDYFKSVGRKETKPMMINPKTSNDKILSNFRDYNINININKLLSVCPFNEKFRTKKRVL